MKCEFLQPEIFEDHRGVIKSFYPDENIVEWMPFYSLELIDV